MRVEDKMFQRVSLKCGMSKAETLTKLVAVILLITGCATQVPVVKEQIVVEPPVVKKYLFFEDFMKVQEGHIPTGWIDCSNMAVKPSSLLKGKNVFYNVVDNKRNNIIIPNIPFKGSFKYNMLFKAEDFGNYETVVIKVVIGQVELKIVKQAIQNVESSFNEAKFFMPDSWCGNNQRNGKIMSLDIIKDGLVCKLIIDGQQMSLIRLAEDFLTDTIAIDAYVGKMSIYQLSVEELTN